MKFLTNLGQLWQGPVNGKGVAEQYLYCNSAPHQLTGIYPIGTTCATKGSATAVYSAGYDAWGNETSRTYNSVTATLSYDQSNRMTEYNAGVNSQEFYLYDASGNRVLKRTISGGSTKLTAYAFGLQELTYTSSGASSGQTDYYAIAGHLIGSTNGSATTYDLTDAEGSVLTSLSSSAVLGEQIYGPYGNQRYTQGTMGTDKGYTGQFQDAATGLDYYNARYYDPVMGQFLSADHVQGNAQGMDPYAYVNGNPETATDPTGQRISCPPDCGGGTGTPCTYGDAGCSGQPVAPTCNAPNVWQGGQCVPPAGYRGGGGKNGAGAGVTTYNCSNGMTGPNCDINTEGICAGYASSDPVCQHKQVVAACGKDTICLHCNDDATCIGQSHASQGATNAAGAFGMISTLLWILSGLVGLFTLLACENPLLCGILGGLTAGLVILAAQAGEIASMFSAENSDSINGIGWFTKADLETSKNGMDAFLNGSGGFSLGGGALTAASRFLSQVAKISGKATTVTAAGVTLDITTLIGDAGMEIAVNNIAASQENDVLT